MLDIIVPHYNEPFSVGKPLFEMLAMQKGIDFKKIRVLLIHDGSEMFPEDNFANYPYEVEQHRISHKGVSAARNFGMAIAKAKWIVFCDFDDTYTDIYAMKYILESLETEDFDLLWNPIYMEDYKGDNFRIFPLDKFNMIFVHNKYIRREFIKKTGLKFNESIEYSEDTCFLSVLNIMLDPKRIGEIKTISPLYAWTYRKESCTTNPANRKRNVRHLFEGNKYIAREFDKLEYENAVLMKFRAITDAYFALTGDDAPVDCDDLKHDVYDYWLEVREEIKLADDELLLKVYKSSRKNGMRGRENSKRPSLTEWLKEIEYA